MWKLEKKSQTLSILTFQPSRDHKTFLKTTRQTSLQIQDYLFPIWQLSSSFCAAQQVPALNESPECLHSHFNRLQLCSVANQRLTSIMAKKSPLPLSQLFKIPLTDEKPLVCSITTQAISPENSSHQLWCCWELLSALAVPLLPMSVLSFPKTNVYQNVFISYKKVKLTYFKTVLATQWLEIIQKNMYGDLS